MYCMAKVFQLITSSVQKGYDQVRVGNFWNKKNINSKYACLGDTLLAEITSKKLDVNADYLVFTAFNIYLSKLSLGCMCVVCKAVAL